jgi:cell pole-organizing protein PopZ
MTASAQRAAEPSMEEILASIRRIIADDQSRARLNSTKLVAVTAPLPSDKPVAPAAAAEPAETQVQLPEAHASDVEAPPEPRGAAEIVMAAPAEPDQARLDGLRQRRDEARSPEPIVAEPAAPEPKGEEARSAQAPSGLSSAAEPLRPLPPEPRSVSEVASSRPALEPGSSAELEGEMARLVQEALAQEALAQDALAQDAPAQDAPAQEIPAREETFQEAAFHETLAHALIQELGTQGLGTQETQPQETQPQETQPQEARTQERFVDETASQEAFAEGAPVEIAEDHGAPAAAPQAQAWQAASEPRAMSPAAPRPPQLGPGRKDVRAAEPRALGAGQHPEPRNREPAAILSSEADLAVARAFNSLSRTVLSDNARTLEDLVTEMLRPLLKAWLDDNLPPLVERLVRIEIERVARGRPD